MTCFSFAVIRILWPRVSLGPSARILIRPSRQPKPARNGRGIDGLRARPVHHRRVDFALITAAARSSTAYRTDLPDRILVVGPLGAEIADGDRSAKTALRKSLLCGLLKTKYPQSNDRILGQQEIRVAASAGRDFKISNADCGFNRP